LKDLRERFAKCAITASEAIVPFRETAVKAAEMNPSKSAEGSRGKFVGTSVSGIVSVTVQSSLLPEPVVEFLQHNAATMQTLQAQDRQTQSEDGPARDDVTTDRTAQLLKPVDFWNKLSSLLDEAGSEWKGIADHIWAFGPKRIGPNLLIDRTGSSSRGLKAKSQLIADAQAQGKTAAEVADLVNQLNEVNITAEASDDQADEKAAQRLLGDFDNNIETGFQLATYRGPLCAEPVIGMAYSIEKIEINNPEPEEGGRKSRARIFQ
jgi:ribosome assembly protein 1